MNELSRPMPHTAAPRISVVIPTFNRARDIARCLDSLIDQTFRDFEVLVCDDGSTDGTREVVARYQGRLALSYHWAENFGGPARPRNIGIGLARGTYVAFLDSDDWWSPEKLASSLRYLEQGADVVYHDLHLATSRRQRLYWRRSAGRELRRPVFEDLLVGGNALNNSSVVIRRSVLESIHGFSEDRDLIAAEDYDAWLRIAKVTDAFAKIPQVLGYYWVGDGNLSNPRRTVTTTEAIEARYSREIVDLRRRHSIHWLSYVKARSYYLLGSHEMARKNLSAIDWRRVPLSIRAKALWMNLLMGLQKSHSQEQ